MMHTQNILSKVMLFTLGVFTSLAYSKESEEPVSGYHPDLTATVEAQPRDPHEYSDGLTLSSGPSLFEGREKLSLADEHVFSSMLVDRLEYSSGREENYANYKALAWIGKDYQKIWFKSDGEYKNSLQETENQILYGYAISSYWDVLMGARYDTYKARSDKGWLALGIQGLAPYWFELDSSLFVDSHGLALLSLEAEYDLLLTQKLILQPQVSVNIYSKDDSDMSVGRGVSDLSAGLRLRYEINRQFAPYIGVEWKTLAGGTYDIAKDNEESTSDTRFITGARFWF
ncbi:MULTISPECIES: copper resistance protein B [Aeromonas]|uniref:copper resistance protein B n=1 Tax=Aeromonas TaxID=642 RepID=UPI001F4104C6|nr:MULTISPECIES: copper resistance protein B [Aeromonas]WDF95976.1 copper resistance protein B [Aeromonas dhakensis]